MKLPEVDAVIIGAGAAGGVVAHELSRGGLHVALLERGVWVQPGYFFGMAESGWLVVSLLGREAEFSTGVTGLVDYLRTHQGGNHVSILL